MPGNEEIGVEPGFYVDCGSYTTCTLYYASPTGKGLFWDATLGPCPKKNGKPHIWLPMRSLKMNRSAVQKAVRAGRMVQRVLPIELDWWFLEEAREFDVLRGVP